MLLHICENKHKRQIASADSPRRHATVTSGEQTTPALVASPGHLTKCNPDETSSKPLLNKIAATLPSPPGHSSHSRNGFSRNLPAAPTQHAENDVDTMKLNNLREVGGFVCPKKDVEPHRATPQPHARLHGANRRIAPFPTLRRGHPCDTPTSSIPTPVLSIRIGFVCPILLLA